ncbi:hypothetical protein [Cryobacterium sp. Y57]|uniref:hypothetical protein n=1 Tax=Cryobacterium sp. Y57 TaxID=2048287 RepID=UPI0011B04918|nr:hypothetical protein [Cryobacterium sp. Y57]
MNNERRTIPVKPSPTSVLPYRVRVEGSTVAAFESYGDAATFAEPIMRELGAVEIALSFKEI